MRCIALICALFIALPAVAANDPAPVNGLKGWTGPKPEKPPCECRGRGGDKVQLGGTMCMKRGDRLVTLQCRMVLNNTIWKELTEGCENEMF